MFLLFTFLLSAYVANAAPPVFGGGKPLDNYKRLSDGRRLLGNGKTVRGFAAGVLSGVVVAIVLAVIGREMIGLSFMRVLLVGVAAACGTMVGDSLGSFIKRRLGLTGSVPIIDQLTFIVVAMLLAAPFLPFLLTPSVVIFILILTYILHVVMNRVAYALGLKDVPW